eukprot:m.29742 g.29742  ORF g.29742 m.29742 type:complete len:1321 (-) comp13774_c0_seq2:1735-5697(-)
MADPIQFDASASLAALANVTVPQMKIGDRTGAEVSLVGGGVCGLAEARSSQKFDCEKNDNSHETVLGPRLQNTMPIQGMPPSPSRLDSASGVKNLLTERYLLNLDALQIHDRQYSARLWIREPQPEKLLSLEFPSLSSTFIKRNYDCDGLAFTESSSISNHYIAGAGGEGELNSRAATAATSSSMHRDVAPRQNFAFGESSGNPFHPGGLDRPDDVASRNPGAIIELDFSSNLLTAPPGFDRGGNFAGAPQHPDDPLPSSLPEFVREVSSVSTGSVNSGDTPMPDEANVTTANKRSADGDGEQDKLASVLELDAVLDATPGRMASSPTRLNSHRVHDASSASNRQRWAIVDEGDVSTFYDDVPTMARSWSFELDVFQKRAVRHLERGESVFVAAHTSAGKTVVADYAIALCAQHMTRCVYTSPIKALSNQKFRDFRKGGVDVGLLTGDIQLKPEAACLVMTTEILRSMLYRGADTIRDVEWVIFDEVHYVNDADRGVVWEEVIIMLPAHVNIIMLSATVPNTLEFADWVGRTKKKPVYVISTHKRPVPLEHFLYVESGEAKGEKAGNTAGGKPKAAASTNTTPPSLFKLVDAAGNLLNDGYRQALHIKTSSQSDRDKNFGAKHRQHGGGGDRSLYLSLVKMLEKQLLQPCVVFTFSKKRCESNADALRGMDLTSTTEKSEIQVFLDASVSRLSGSDRELPQVLRMKEMLKRGVGVHHGGLLPLIKEMVEMLFGRGLVKVLFATETFAMGVNMPARCVVFDTIRKFDGEGFRDLLSGEYIQMAGRAGRRGLDDTGTVIVLVKGDLPELSDLNRMILGVPTRLDSKFRLTYNMILNVLRVEELRMEDMIKRSFAENSTQRAVSGRKAELERCSTQLAALEGENAVACHRCAPDLNVLYDHACEYLQLAHTVLAGVVTHGAKFLGTGRVVVVNTPTHRNCIAVVVRAAADARSAAATLVHAGTATALAKRFVVVVLQDPNAASQGAPPLLPVNRLAVPTHASGAVVTVTGADIVTVAKAKISSVPASLKASDIDGIKDAARQLHRFASATPHGLPPLDVMGSMKIRDMETVDAFLRQQQLMASIEQCNCCQCPTYTECYANYHNRRHLDDLRATLQFQLSDESMQLLPEYKQRVDVLKLMGYIDDQSTVQLKGRVACEVSTCDELIATELVFENVLTALHPAEIVALLSSLVFQEKVDVEPNLTPVLQRGVEDLVRIATVVARAQEECGLDTPPAEFLRTTLHFGLVEVVHAWARGVPFADITGLTDVLEGSIVRCIVRLDETCRDFRNAARVIGDPVLHQKMDEASVLIKRDIVFAASLYTQ